MIKEEQFNTSDYLSDIPFVSSSSNYSIPESSEASSNISSQSDNVVEKRFLTPNLYDSDSDSEADLESYVRPLRKQKLQSVVPYSSEATSSFFKRKSENDSIPVSSTIPSITEPEDGTDTMFEELFGKLSTKRHSVSKKRSTKKRRSATKKRSTKKRSTKKRSTKKRSVKRASKKRRSVSKKRSTKKRSTKKRRSVSKKRSTKKRSVKRASKKRPVKRASKKRASKKRSVKRASKKRSVKSKRHYASI